MAKTRGLEAENRKLKQELADAKEVRESIIASNKIICDANAKCVEAKDELIKELQSTLITDFNKVFNRVLGSCKQFNDELQAKLVAKDEEIARLKSCSGLANPNICQVCGTKLMSGMLHSCM